MTGFSWECLNFSELDALKLYRILKARFDVFVLEQASIYNELDNFDFVACHLMANGGEGEITAYLRILPPGLKYAEASIGRVLVQKAFRGTGLGQELMRRSLHEVATSYPKTGVRIEAQSYLQRFYLGFGFKPVSEPFDDGGIMHLEMLLAQD